MWFRIVGSDKILIQKGAEIVGPDGARYPYEILTSWTHMELASKLNVHWESELVTGPSRGLNNTGAIKEAVGQTVDDKELEDLRSQLTHSDAKVEQVGFFGNIWIRQLTLKSRGDYHQGHRHNFDHISLVAKGSVLCEVDGCAPKVFKAPAWITIKKDDWHKFTSLEEDTVYFCIYALRDVDGNVTDVFSGANSPYGEAPMTADEVRKRLDILNQYGGCAHCSCED